MFGEVFAYNGVEIIGPSSAAADNFAQIIGRVLGNFHIARDFVTFIVRIFDFCVIFGFALVVAGLQQKLLFDRSKKTVFLLIENGSFQSGFPVAQVLESLVNENVISRKTAIKAQVALIERFAMLFLDMLNLYKDKVEVNCTTLKAIQ